RAAFDTKLIYAGTRRGGRSAFGNETRRDPNERNGALGRLKIARGNSLLDRVPDAGMRQVQALHLLERVVDAGDLQIKRMVVGERNEVETEGLQRLKRFGRR